MKRRFFLHVPLLAVGMLVAACSGDDGAGESEVPVPDSPTTWRVSINAASAEEADTRAISIGGNTGVRLYTNWDEGDEVEVVRNNAVVGTLTASISGNNSANAKLDGTLSGTYAVGDAITLFYHHAALNYSPQLGTLADVSANHDYLSGASTVKTVDAQGGYLQMTDATFEHIQAFLELNFTNQSDVALNISQLDVYSSSGKLVLSKSVNGTTTYATAANRLQITPATSGSKFFMALRNESGAKDTYTFIAKVGSTFYSATKASTLQYGHYYRGTVKMSVYDHSYPDVDVNRTDYGKEDSWLKDITADINRISYGTGLRWSMAVSANLDRGTTYGSGTLWDPDMSGNTIDRGTTYGSGNLWDPNMSGNTFNRGDTYGTPTSL